MDIVNHLSLFYRALDLKLEVPGSLLLVCFAGQSKMWTLLPVISNHNLKKKLFNDKNQDLLIPFPSVHRNMIEERKTMLA